MRTILLRAAAPLFLGIHLALSFFPALKGMWSELFLYNSIALCALFIVLAAPRIIDRHAQPLIASAIALWLCGSLISSISLYFSIAEFMQLVANIAYLLFYPFALLGLPRLLSTGRKFSLLEIFDSSIVGLGLTTLGATLVLKPVLPHFDGQLSQSFFAVSYPIADLILISLTVAAVVAQGFSYRGFILTLWNFNLHCY